MTLAMRRRVPFPPIINGWREPAVLTLFAITTGAQTVTLQQVTPTGGNCIVSWGDGGADSVIVDGNTGTTTHNYAGAGTWTITITNARLITALYLRDTKLGCIAGTIGGLNRLTYLRLRDVTNVIVGEGEVDGLTHLTTLQLENVAANVTISAGEIGTLTNLTRLYLSNATNVTINAGEIGTLTNLETLWLSVTANVTIGTNEISALTNLDSLYLANVGSVAISGGEISALTNVSALWLQNVPNAVVNAGEIGTLTNLYTLYLQTAPNVTINAGEIGGLVDLSTIYLIDVANVTTQRADFATLPKLVSLTYRNSLTQPQVDAVLAGLYDVFPTKTGNNGTVDIAGTNAAPSGIYQAPGACPPTDGKEIAYELKNDTCAVSLKHWATITFTP